jgi:hypothetical protein
LNFFLDFSSNSRNTYPKPNPKYFGPSTQILGIGSKTPNWVDISIQEPSSFLIYKHIYCFVNIAVPSGTVDFFRRKKTSNYYEIKIQMSFNVPPSHLEKTNKRTTLEIEIKLIKLQHQNVPLSLSIKIYYFQICRRDEKWWKHDGTAAAVL